jgi:hypothetical protein
MLGQPPIGEGHYPIGDGLEAAAEREGVVLEVWSRVVASDLDRGLFGSGLDFLSVLRSVISRQVGSCVTLRKRSANHGSR